MSHSQLPVLFLLTVQSFSIFGCKEYNQSDFGVDHLVMSICGVLCCWKRLFAMISAFLWQAFAPLLSVFQVHICLLLQVLFDFLLLHSSLYNEKNIIFGVSSKRSCTSSQNRSTSASSALLVGAQTWITVILNGLPWKRTEIILWFLRLHPSAAFWILLLTLMATPFLLRDSCHSSRYQGPLS